MTTRRLEKRVTTINWAAPGEPEQLEYWLIPKHVIREQLRIERRGCYPPWMPGLDPRLVRVADRKPRSGRRRR